MTLSLRSLLLISPLTLLIACGGGAGVPDVDAPDAIGPFAVGYASFTADAARDDRSLPVDVWYPVDPEDAQGASPATYPLAKGVGLDSEVALEAPAVSSRPGQTLLVFSHGYEGINKQSIELMEALASHGFVVASPEHVGNSNGSPGDPFDTAAANRVPDVSFVIDTMLARSQDAEDAFHDRLDETRVGVIGNSFGAMTAIGTASGWAGAAPDPRVAAIVPVSGVIDAELQGDDRDSPNAGFTAEQLGSIVVPVMLVGGTEDVNVFIENNAIAFEQLTNAPNVYKVDVIGANHTHFANVCTFGNLLLELGITQDIWPTFDAGGLIEPYEATCTADAFPIEEAIRLQNLYAVSFFRRHLLGEEDYDFFLTEKYAKKEPAITFSVK